MLAFGKEVILAEHRRDCDDRERIRKGETVAVARKKELVSACSSQLFQLDMRPAGMTDLPALLLVLALIHLLTCHPSSTCRRWLFGRDG